MDIINKTSDYIKSLFEEDLRDSLVYHNLNHTLMVVDAANKISKEMRLSSSEQEIVILAAWFHDAGFTVTYQDHEDESASIANLKLSEWKYPLHKIDQVVTGILDTKMPQSPKNKLGEILCDADLYHLSHPKYWEYNDRLYEELRCCLGMDITNDEWLINNLKFLKNHNYYTRYAQTYLEPLKKLHIKENLRRVNNRSDLVHA